MFCYVVYRFCGEQNRRSMKLGTMNKARTLLHGQKGQDGNRIGLAGISLFLRLFAQADCMFRMYQYVRYLCRKNDHCLYARDVQSFFCLSFYPIKRQNQTRLSGGCLIG